MVLLRRLGINDGTYFELSSQLMPASGRDRKLVNGAHVTIVVASIPNRYAIRKAEAIAAARQFGAALVLPPGEGETRASRTGRCTRSSGDSSTSSTR